MSSRIESVRTAFVACPSYHGATLLALLLNNHSGVSALGDTNPSREYDQTCACQLPVSACAFWQTVVRRLATGRFADYDRMLPTLPWPLRTRTLEGGSFPVSPSVRLNRAAGGLLGRVVDGALAAAWRPGSRWLVDYVRVWREFYGLVAELHGTTLVIDGSKSARKVAIMARELPDCAGVIHLVRDPRGFAASSRRYDPRVDLRASAWLWSDLHQRIERLRGRLPYARVRYEDLAADPQHEVDKLFAFLGVRSEPVVAAPRFPQKHHLMGNSMLFGFNGTVKRDERWRDELREAEQRLVLQCAGATATRYGYE